MAVDDPAVIDIISLDASGCVVLAISDHLDWLDSISHQLILQEKINRYLAFIESGEILDSYPTARGRSLLIDVITQYEPDADGLLFLVRMKSALSQAGFNFRWRYSP
jgi:hypothetical protein